MKFSMQAAEVFIPDGSAEESALARTTHLGIVAHHDDLEIMAIEGILRGYEDADSWFTGVVVTDGGGSPRAGKFANHSDDAMKSVRAEEQKKAASMGRYGAQIMLGHPSATVKDPAVTIISEEFRAILEATSPDIVYTHNPADKHDTHIAVMLCVIEAIRTFPAEQRPEKVYGGEVWRDLDWMLDDDKVVIDCSAHEALQAQLMSAFESQIAGGKRYDLAALGRRRAHATYHESHGVDVMTGVTFAMDLTPLIEVDTLDVTAYVQNYIDRLSDDVASRIGRFRQP